MCEDNYAYEDIWNPVLVVSETLNCEREVKNPQGHYTVTGLRKYVTTVDYVLRMCHLIHLHMIFNKAW